MVIAIRFCGVGSIKLRSSGSSIIASWWRGVNKEILCLHKSQKKKMLWKWCLLLKVCYKGNYKLELLDLHRWFGAILSRNILTRKIFTWGSASTQCFLPCLVQWKLREECRSYQIKTEESPCTANWMSGESSDIIHSMYQFQQSVHKIKRGMKIWGGEG